MSTTKIELNYVKNKFLNVLHTGNLQTLQYLILLHPDCLHWHLDNNHAKSIHIAVRSNQVTLVDFLLTKDLTLLNATDNDNKTPLIWAGIIGNKDLINELIKHGADLTISNNKHKSALYWTTQYGFLDCMKLLIIAGSTIIDKRNSHVMHIAARYGKLDILQYLLRTAPFLINLEDKDKRTPLYWAAVTGHLHSVKFLLQNKAKLHNKKLPDNAYHHMMNLFLTADNNEQAEINMLIIQLINKKNAYRMLKLITNGAQALELLIIDPSLKLFLLSNYRIMALIQKDPHCCSDKPNSLSLYRPSMERQNSFFAKLYEDKATIFTAEKELGKGNHGLVRQFKSTDNQYIAIKSLLKSNDTRKNLIDDAERELQFLEKSLLTNNDCGLFHFKNKTDKTGYTNRLLMPYLHGVNFWQFVQKIKDYFQLGKVVLATAIELNRLHQIGIIHGDIKFDNIIINYDYNNEIKIHFIDFGLAYHLREQWAISLIIRKTNSIYPPERVCPNKAAPHPSQDIYSFGAMLTDIFSNHFIKLVYPCIHTFSLACENVIAEQRPHLNDFIATLTRELANHTNPELTVTTITQENRQLKRTPNLYP